MRRRMRYRQVFTKEGKAGGGRRKNGQRRRRKRKRREREEERKEEEEKGKVSIIINTVPPAVSARVAGRRCIVGAL